LKYSDSVKKLAPALLAVQGKIKNLKKEVINEELNTMYVDLPTVLKFIRPILQSENIVLIQGTDKVDGEEGIVTRLMHVSGEYVETTTSAKMVDVANSFEDLQLDKTNYLQKYGGQITYMRRYALFTLLAIGTEDNDGNEPKSVQAEDMAETFRDKALKTSMGKKSKPEATITLAQRIEALPDDVKDLFKRIGLILPVHRLAIMRRVEWDVEAAKKECLKRIKAMQKKGPRGPHPGLETLTPEKAAELEAIGKKHKNNIRKRNIANAKA
jgi:hypothetical protein